MTFRQWLRQHLREDTALGDLARDFQADRCMPRQARTEEAQREHLEGHGAIQAALDVHAQAWEQYRTETA